jgi:hypothetical protein
VGGFTDNADEALQALRMIASLEDRFGMSKRWRTTVVWQWALLIATAIQGLTPDPNDLSSTWLFSWVGRNVANGVAVVSTDFFGGRRDRDAANRQTESSESIPLDDDFHDELPDEVCAPARGAGLTEHSEGLGRRPSARHFADHPSVKLVEPGRVLVVLAGRQLQPSSAPLNCLCRLIC